MRQLQAVVLAEFGHYSLGTPLTVAQLRKRCGNSPRMIRSALTSLMLDGYIEPGKPAGQGRGQRTPTYVSTGGKS